MSSREIRKPLPISRRSFVLITIGALGVIAFFELGLSPAGLFPSDGGVEIASEFFQAALAPALDYQAEFVPESAPAFLVRVLNAVRRTLVFAAASMALSLVGGILLGLLSASCTWSSDAVPEGTRTGRLVQNSLGRSIQVGARLLIAGMRSVHELLWAVIFLAAFGFSTASAVIAIAIPFTGVLAKVFSELLDEAPDNAAYALRACGNSRIRSIVFGRLPAALPDLAAYSFYRFECAVRSSAVLGFFGFETLGYYIRASFENLHYREVWTFLYALIAIVLVFEYWSAAIRRRLAV